MEATINGIRMNYAVEARKGPFPWCCTIRWPPT